MVSFERKLGFFAEGVQGKGGKTSYERNTGLFSLENESGRVGGLSSLRKKAGIHGLTKEERSENGRKGGKISGSKTKLNSTLWFDPDHPELGAHHFNRLGRLQREHGYPSGREYRQKAPEPGCA